MWDDRPQLRKSKARILPEFWCARFTPGSSGWETVAHLQVGKLSSFFCEEFLPKIRCRLATCKLRGDVENIRRMTGFRIESFLKACTMNNVHPWIWHRMVVRQTLQCCEFSVSFPGTTTCLLCCALWKQLVDLGWGTEWGHLNGPRVSREGGISTCRESVFVVFPHLTWCKGRDLLKFCSGILVAGFFLESKIHWKPMTSSET